LLVAAWGAAVLRPCVRLAVTVRVTVCSS
jgi:hypothetical protein